MYSVIFVENSRDFRGEQLAPEASLKFAVYLSSRCV